MTLLSTLKKSKKAKPVEESVVVPATVVVPAVVTEEQQAVDNLVALHLVMQERGVFDLIKKYEAAKKVCGEFAKMHDTDEALLLGGTRGRLEYSPKANSTVVSDKAAVVEVLGQDVFNQLATVTITDLRKYLNPVELARCTEDKKGTRSLKNVLPTLG